MNSQGMQSNQQITFLSDGEDSVHDMQMHLNPSAEHILNWFHITMRLTLLLQIAKGLGGVQRRGVESAEDNKLPCFFHSPTKLIATVLDWRCPWLILNCWGGEGEDLNDPEQRPVIGFRVKIIVKAGWTR